LTSSHAALLRLDEGFATPPYMKLTHARAIRAVAGFPGPVQWVRFIAIFITPFKKEHLACERQGS